MIPREVASCLEYFYHIPKSPTHTSFQPCNGRFYSILEGDPRIGDGGQRRNKARLVSCLEAGNQGDLAQAYCCSTGAI